MTKDMNLKIANAHAIDNITQNISTFTNLN